MGSIYYEIFLIEKKSNFYLVRMFDLFSNCNSISYVFVLKTIITRILCFLTTFNASRFSNIITLLFRAPFYVYHFYRFLKLYSEFKWLHIFFLQYVAKAIPPVAERFSFRNWLTAGAVFKSNRAFSAGPFGFSMFSLNLRFVCVHTG